MCLLDCLIAERVMGLEIRREPGELEAIVVPKGSPPNSYGADLPSYSTDIAAAWGPVEELVKRNNGAFCLSHIVGERWRCEIFGGYVATVPDDVEGIASKAPLAICLAALKAVGVTEEEVAKTFPGGV